MLCGMPIYRLYRINEEGRIEEPPVLLQLATDDAALREAKRHVDGHNIEVWKDDGLVGLVTPDENLSS